MGSNCQQPKIHMAILVGDKGNQTLTHLETSCWERHTNFPLFPPSLSISPPHPLSIKEQRNMAVLKKKFFPAWLEYPTTISTSPFSPSHPPLLIFFSLEQMCLFLKGLFSPPPSIFFHVFCIPGLPLCLIASSSIKASNSPWIQGGEWKCKMV